MNSKDGSSRRVILGKEAHATATEKETERTISGVLSHGNNYNRYSKSEADRRQREARHRIGRTREQRQAARYFCNLQGVVRRV